MKKFTVAIILSLLFTFFVSAYSKKIEHNLSDNIIRLHIIAESDSQNDQAVKLKVRDRIIKEMSPVLSQSDDINKSKQIILDNMDKIKSIADDELRKNGFSYTAEAYLGESEFPTKVYNNITLPKGKYTSLKIILGNGEGQNWWCVMYPPLCFVDDDIVISDESNTLLKNNLSEDVYELITKDGEQPDIEVKFKIVELFSGV